MGHHGHSADHLRHLLQHQKEIGLTEEQVKKLKAIELDFDRARIKSDAEIQNSTWPLSRHCSRAVSTSAGTLPLTASVPSKSKAMTRRYIRLRQG